MTNINDALLHCQQWGRQTVLFAISVRAHRDGRSIDDPEQIKHATTATEDIAKQLWTQACSDKIPNFQIPLVFSGLVFEWVSDHLTPS